MSERTFHERPEVIRGHKFIRLKSGRLIHWWEALRSAERAKTDMVRSVSRLIKLTHDDRELATWDLERVRWFIEELGTYVGAVLEHLDKLDGVKTQEERIERLRLTTGRTPEEAELFKRKADELERRLKEQA